MNKELEKIKAREYAARYYRKNRERLLARMQERYENDEERREAVKTRAKRMLKEESQKTKARQAVRNAIYWKGLKRKSCETCGDPKTHAHHKDYSKPLEVNWLCPTHHGERHQKYAF